ncbi:MAG: phosphoribosylaminoimidazolesuccinocarboxamide synthase [Planctomycetota bacterium]|nr:phosphoribosylaminoimidazolesuccinocarboxamide synthase [Planctomycetota bacterium]
MTTNLLRQGKVRDIYDAGDHLLLVASDRVSAFDWVIPTEIPDKGRVLTQISNFWFDRFDVPNHLVKLDLQQLEVPRETSLEQLEGRGILVKKCEVVPIECVVRGYLAGSGWREYRKDQTVCGLPLPDGLENGSQLPEPVFTPATKAEEGHDENIPFERMIEIVGEPTAVHLREKSLEIYRQGAEYARTKGIIIADTKFEWGWHEGELILIDEVLTPDSSRFWPEDKYLPGGEQFSFDKQFVRNYLDQTDWDKNSQPPELPAEIVDRTRSKYIEAFERLTDQPFPWK